jgi:hypothetical protein
MCWDSGGTLVACAGTGQDGDVRAGTPLSYTDNGDGTIIDNNTGLVWEKLSMDGTVHDVGNAYTWDQAFSGHVATLNSGAGLAGHTDWRLPNVKELQSIVNYERFGPAVSSAFNTGCMSGCTVLTCSCTASSFYWSSTTEASGPGDAWVVFFKDGDVVVFGKNVFGFVRGVRGGS